MTYTAKAFGKIETASEYDEAGDVITLNSKPAIEQYRHPKTRNQKPETRNQKPETRNQKPERLLAMNMLNQVKTF